MKIKDFLLDLIFPKQCLKCSRFDYVLCPDCITELKADFIDTEFKKHRILSFYKYNKYNILIELLKEFKYAYNKELLGIFKSLLYNNLEKLDFIKKKYSKIYLVPMPLHKKRYKERDFNQAEELAKIFQTYLNAILLKDIVIRVKNNSKQSQLEFFSERKENMHEVFALSKKYEIDKESVFLIIDDVITTGASSFELIRELKQEYSYVNFIVLTFFYVLR